MLMWLLKYVGWNYFPNYASSQLLSVVHSAYPRVFGTPPPVPGSPAYQRHLRWSYLFVVASFLLYAFCDTAAKVEPNYYQMLGVEPTADESTLKMAFRQFARRHHPDRVGPQGEAIFIQVRDAYEALKSPVKRFAYDRFGPDALGWSQCSTLREYIRHGLMQASGFYITSTCILLLLSASGRSGPVAFWRYILLALIAVYEMLFILDPSPSASPASPSTPLSSALFADPASTAHTSLFSLLWPRRVAYQHVRFLHSMFVLCSFALSNVAPVLFPQPSAEMEERVIVGQAQQILQVSNQIASEANAQLQMLFHAAHGPRTGTPAQDSTFPFLGELQGVQNEGRPADEVVGLLARELENLILETQLRADGGPLKSAVDNAVERERRRRAAGGGGGGGRYGTVGSPGKESWMTRRISGIGMNGFAGLLGRNGNGNGYADGDGNGSSERSYDGSPSPVRGERTVLGYVRGRSRSLG